MILKVTLGFIILGCGVSFAQLGGAPERSSVKNMEMQRWVKAESKLRKILQKDTVNASIRYLLSVYYFKTNNPTFNLDSAYYYAITALKDFQKTSGREREKLRRMPLDSLRLTSLKESIDSAAFEVAKSIHTEASYLQFLDRFLFASQREQATQLRDEVAYLEAAKENTWQAFINYLKRYPGARRAPQARTQYNQLLYFSETADQRLSSYENFITTHPETPYREEIYKNIFEISTADGSVESFLKFIARYPLSDMVKRARQLIFHILAEEESPTWPGQFLNDSLQNLYSIKNTYLVPVLKNDLFGFINEDGKEIIPPSFKNIHPDYLCGNITEEVLMLDNKLVGRNGSLVYDGSMDEVTELGIGFLKIKTGNEIKVVHKAGFIFEDSLQDARVLSKRYIAIKKSNGWLLYTLTGRLLDENHWDDISAFQDIIVLYRDRKVFIATKSNLGLIAEGSDLKLSEPFDEVKQWPHNLIWVKASDLEGVLNQSLQPVIKMDKHQLIQTFFGAIAAAQTGFSLYNWAGQKASSFAEVNVFGPWVAVKKQQSWYLFEPYLQEIESQAYDSIKAEGPFVMGLLTDTVFVHFAKNNTAQFIQPGAISFVPGKDSTSFLLIEGKDRIKSLFDLQGIKLFSAAVDAVEYAGQEIFVLTRKDKKGLTNASGETLLQIEFDAIGSVKEQVVTILKGKRFGCYHILQKKFIKPQYERNLYPYTDQVLITFKDGYYGFLGWDNKPLSHFEFDEIKYWDNSVAMVRKGSLWNFYNIPSGKMIENNFRNITLIKNAQDEKIAIIQKDGTYGVLSNRRNVVIPVSYSDIINLGSADEPLYFTEKHIKEASLFIVIYYDRFGKMIRKELYEDASDYDKIYCSDN